MESAQVTALELAEKKETKFAQIAKVARRGATATHAPSKYGLMTENMRTTAAGVFDTTTGTWVVRLDNAHPGTPTPHINVNSAVSGVPDPHKPVPKVVLTAGRITTKAIQVGGKVALVAGIVVDSARIGNAIVDDCKNTKKKLPGKKTAKVVSSVGGGWAGGFLGAKVGNSTGAVIGGIIGSLFGGGVGKVIGSVIGSAIGSVYGAISGGKAGSEVAENLVEEYISDSEEEDEGKVCKKIVR